MSRVLNDILSKYDIQMLFPLSEGQLYPALNAVELHCARPSPRSARPTKFSNLQDTTTNLNEGASSILWRNDLNNYLLWQL